VYLNKPNSHKSIGDAHRANDQDVQEERHDNDALVETDQAVVLAQTVLHQIRIDDADEVPIEVSVEEKK